MNIESIRLVFIPDTTIILVLIPSPWVNTSSRLTLAAIEKWLKSLICDLLPEAADAVHVQSHHAGENVIFIHVQVHDDEIIIPLHKDDLYTSVAFMLKPFATLFIRTDLYPVDINIQRWFRATYVARLVGGEPKTLTYSSAMSELNVYMQDRFGFPTLAPRFLFKHHIDEGKTTPEQAVATLMEDLRKRHIHATSEIIVRDWVDAGLPPRPFSVDLTCFKEGQCILQ